MAIDWTINPFDVSKGVGAFSQGFLTPALAKNQISQAKLNQFKVGEEQRRQEAMKQYGETGDPNALRGVDPKMAMQIQNWIDTRPPEELTKLAKATQYMEMTRPFVNTQNWPMIREQVVKLGAPEQMLPPADASPEQLNQAYYGSQIAAAKIDAMKKGPQHYKPGDFVTDPVSGKMTQVPYGEKERAEIDLTKKKAEDPYFGKTPNYAKPYNKDGPIISLKPGEAPPAGYEFVSPHGRSQTRTMSDENKTTLVQGMKDGEIPPSMLSKRAGDYNDIVAEAKRQGVKLSQLQTEYEGAKRFAQSMNSSQMVRYQGLAGSVVGTINEVKELSNQMELSGLRPLNYLELQALTKTAGNTPQGQLATRYVTAVNTLKEEFANLAQGGYAPTESVWHLANKQINENFGIKQMESSLDEIKRLVQYRSHAFEELKPMKGGQSGKPNISGMSRDQLESAYKAQKAKFANAPKTPENKQREAALDEQHQENLRNLGNE